MEKDVQRWFCSNIVVLFSAQQKGIKIETEAWHGPKGPKKGKSLIDDSYFLSSHFVLSLESQYSSLLPFPRSTLKRLGVNISQRQCAAARHYGPEQKKTQQKKASNHSLSHEHRIGERCE